MYDEAIRRLKAHTFAAKMDRFFSEEEMESLFNEILSHGEEPALKETWEENYPLWKKAVGEEVAEDMKLNPSLPQIVKEWAAGVALSQLTEMSKELAAAFPEEAEVTVEDTMNFFIVHYK